LDGLRVGLADFFCGVTLGLFDGVGEALGERLAVTLGEEVGLAVTLGEEVGEPLREGEGLGLAQK